jgi:glycosyltransferase involved in cell wall biosynthesis
MKTVNGHESVLFLLGTLEQGGTESKFVRLVNRLAKQGRSVHVAYLGGPETLLPSLGDVPTVNLERKGKWSLRAYRKLSSYVDEHSIASIVTANLYPLCYAVPLRFSRRSTAPSIIASINTSEMLSARERAFMLVYTPLLKRCEQIVFGAEKQRDDWMSSYKLPIDRAKVIYNGVDGEFFDAESISESRQEIRTRLSLPKDADVIVCVSRLRPEKAHGNLLHALAELERDHEMQAHVVLVGDGPERAAIAACAKELGVDARLHMIGASDDVRPYLKAADVFALTSTAVETFSNAALEAAAMGLPVISSDVGGAKEMFPAGGSGSVYPRDDISALVDALAVTLRNVRSGSLDRSKVRHDILKRFAIEAMDEAWVASLWKREK